MLNYNINLEGKTILVTGAAGFIVVDDAIAFSIWKKSPNSPRATGPCPLSTSI